ncbi:auxin-responsive protein IAA1-like isoform X2 [Mangifera indica]|uniref:auxin-responsive protein IAA1-like isoform X2 n=1 Tax=Mangifera indica TaxID=29780 RepID=UPI001CFA7947|nr:auxin-responsive protein IAA1-like isoform X2 [Mangifera indica]
MYAVAMSNDATADSPESDASITMNFDDTELTLGLPGEGRSPAGGKSYAKRGFIETVDLNLGSSRGNANTHVSNNSESQNGKLPAAKAQVTGWPPVRSFRKKELERSSKLVKVAVDGAPYLRKVDLEIYSSYEELLKTLEKMLTCFTLQGNDRNKVGGRVAMEYVATYEDKEGDWMLVGDVPWKMFMESCNRIRLMKSSEAMGLGTPTNSCISIRKLKQNIKRIQGV